MPCNDDNGVTSRADQPAKKVNPLSENRQDVLCENPGHHPSNDLEDANNVPSESLCSSSSGNAECGPQKNHGSDPRNNSGCEMNANRRSNDVGNAIIQICEQQQPKARRTARKRNLPRGHSDKPPLTPRTRHDNLDAEKQPASKHKRKRVSRSKFRTTAVQAAFKSLERPRTERKKAMSQVYPPLLEDEIEFAIDSDEDCEEFKNGRVMMWDPIRKRKIAGAASPLRKNLDDYLRKKCFMQVFYGQDSLLERDRRPRRDDYGWSDSRNEVVVERGGEVPMCKIVRRD